MRFCFALDGTLVNCVDDDFEDASRCRFTEEHPDRAGSSMLLGIRSSSGRIEVWSGAMLVQPWPGRAP